MSLLLGVVQPIKDPAAWAVAVAIIGCCLLLAEHCLLQLQEERNAKGELKQLLAGAVQSERAAEKKLADVSAELETVKSRMAKAEAALQVGSLFLVSPPFPCGLFTIHTY